jgi:hypothetical protein
MDRMLRSHIGVMLLLCAIGICCLLFNGDIIFIINNIVSDAYPIIKLLFTDVITIDNFGTFMLGVMGVICICLMFAFNILLLTPSQSDRIETEENIDWKRNG